MSKLLSPAFVGGLELKNRVIMSPMCMYEVKNEDGIPTVFHTAHYGARAIGGVSLIIIEATAVEPRGRISKFDLGLWDDSQVAPFKELVSSLKYLGAKVGVQIAHAGRKGYSDEVVSASAIRFSEDYQVPEELSISEISNIQDKFVDAVRRADLAGFDMIELHGAHGYLINQFLSPITNKRTDKYGGSLENRFLFLKEIIEKIKPIFQKPIWVRLSLTAYEQEQNSIEDWKQIGKWLEALGVKCLDISTGGVTASKPNIPVGDGFQVPFAKAMKDALSIDIAAVGLLDNFGLAEYLVNENCADIILQGRSLIRNINWLNDAAKHLRDETFTPFNTAYGRGQK